MPSITLTDIRKAVEAKYAPYTVELSDGTSVSFLPVLRLSKTKRADLRRLQKERDAYDKSIKAAEEAGEEVDDDYDHDGYLRSFLRIVADNEIAAQRLFDEVGDDLGVLSYIVGEYSSELEPGEASPSES